MVAIEHRYFGLSCPYALKYSEFSTWNPTSLKPLTLENALFDGISLLYWIKTVAYPAAKEAKVIVVSGMSTFGASLSGSCLAPLRMGTT